MCYSMLRGRGPRSNALSVFCVAICGSVLHCAEKEREREREKESETEKRREIEREIERERERDKREREKRRTRRERERGGACIQCIYIYLFF